MSGEISLSTNTKIENIKVAVNEAYDKFKIKDLDFKLNINEITKYECYQRISNLQSLSLSIQLEYNTLQSQYNYLDALLKRTVYPNESDYSGSWEARFWLVINNNNACKEIHNQILRLKVHLDALEFIVRRIDNFINTLYKIAEIKK